MNRLLLVGKSPWEVGRVKRQAIILTLQHRPVVQMMRDPQPLLTAVHYELPQLTKYALFYLKSPLPEYFHNFHIFLSVKSVGPLIRD
jgi:hypothetical protein